MKDSTRHGFSLIEILIVISILILFSGMSIAYFNEFTEDKKLESESRKVVDVLELAKKKARAADLSRCSFDPLVTPQVRNYSLVVVNPTEYQIVPECLTGTPAPIIYNLEKNVMFMIPTVAVDFYPLSAGASKRCLYLRNSISNKCRNVKVGEVGLIDSDTCTCNMCCP